MDKNIKIIIIGFGSIGQRHYKNLIKMGYKNVFVYDTEKEKIQKGVKIVENLKPETLSQFKVAFICNPTSIHIETALKCAESGCNLFIEKPLSNSLKGSQELIKICKDKKLISMVACNLRFELCLKKIKELIDKGYLGKMYAIYLEYGRFLPYQRKGTDYRKVYASQKKLGGGIILDDIHDFDLLFWFNNFTEAKKCNFISSKLSDLEMDVEDIANASFEFKNGVLGSVRCDYLQQYKHKNCKIIGEKGNLNWNFRENAVYFEYSSKAKGEQTKKVFHASDDADLPYVDQLKYYLNCLDGNKKTFNDVERSEKILKLIVKNR